MSSSDAFPSYHAPSRRRVIVAIGGLLFSLVVLAGICAYPVVVSALAPEGSNGADLAALRFVTVGLAAGPGQTMAPSRGSLGSTVGGKFEIWVDGKRRIQGLSDGVSSPSLLLGPGEHAVEVRESSVTRFSSPLTIAGGSSTTYVISAVAGTTQILSVDDAAETKSKASIAVLNLTGEAIAVRVGDEELVVQSGKVSNEARFALPGNPVIAINNRKIPTDPAMTGSKLILVTTALEGTREVLTSVIPANRYPASMLRTGDAAPSLVLADDGHNAEYWLRRILSGFVVVLVVTATLATLRSFRAQALDSRVRARME